MGGILYIIKLQIIKTTNIIDFLLCQALLSWVF